MNQQTREVTSDQIKSQSQRRHNGQIDKPRTGGAKEFRRVMSCVEWKCGHS